MNDRGTVAFVVEHLDPELGPWSALEYACIARESHASGARFLLSSVPAELQMPADLAATQGLEVEQRSVEEIFADRKDKVCLLDPAAQVELSPEDGDTFEVFLFGGILGMQSFLSHGCTRKVRANMRKITGDDPPRGLYLILFLSRCIPGRILRIDIFNRSDLRIEKERLRWSTTGPKTDDDRHSCAGDSNDRA